MPVESQKSENKKATISLSDCLACTGCLTSSEEIILSSQGIDQLKQILIPPLKICPFVSISSQVISSFSLYYKISMEQTFCKFVKFFNSLGISYIFDTQFAHYLSGELYTRELACKKTAAPLISSECPAWFLYAYKKLSNELLGALSTVKSEQRILGTLVKLLGNQEKDKEKLDNFYHIAICSCNDKKVEAALGKTEEKQKDIDLILTANEIFNFIALSTDFSKLDPEKNPINLLDFIKFKPTFPMKYAIQPINTYPPSFIQLIQNSLKIEYKTLGNKDFKITENGQYKMALVGGYRNIQKIIAILKSGKTIYQFIELYACPGECYSGAELLDTKEKLSEIVKNEKITEILENTMSEFKKLISEFLLKYPMISKELTEEIKLKKEEDKKLDKIAISNVKW